LVATLVFSRSTSKLCWYSKIVSGLGYPLKNLSLSPISEF